MDDKVKATRKKLSEYTLDPQNANAGSVRGNTILETSVGEFGPARSGVVDQNGIMRAGNHTAEQLMAAGIEDVIEVEADGKSWVVVKRTDMDARTGQKYAVVDNQSGLFVDWNAQVIDEMLKNGINFDQYFNPSEMDAILSGLPTEEPGTDNGPRFDEIDELHMKWGVKPGDLWLIPSKTVKGEHRLLCGDSTSEADVKRLMDGKRAVLFSTDPPYLVDYDGTNHPHKWNASEEDADRLPDWDDASQGIELYDQFIALAIQEAITEDAAWYCWHASRNQSMLEAVWTKYGAFVHQQILWVKDRPILTRSWYMWQHEPCFFGWVKPHKPKRVAKDYPPTVWTFPTLPAGEQSVHPTSKPTDLFAIPIRQHCSRGDIVYEPFSGSGSQQVAAEQEKALCFGLERKPEYCAIILQRLSDMGLSPVRSNNGST